MRKVVFYSLMLFDENKKSTGYNGLQSSFDENIKIYVNQCLLLKLSLNYFGYTLKIVSNDTDYLIYLSDNVLCESDLIYMPISEAIPSDTNFYLSMHKFDLIKKLVSKKIDHYAFIIDSDIVCLRPIPLNVSNIIDKGILTYYDISDQHIPAFGTNSVIRDVNMIDSKSNFGIWSGGEYIGGDYLGLSKIDNCVSDFIAKYFECCNVLNQKSDENLYSLFIQNAISRGVSVVDIGKHFFFSRFWSIPTMHIPDSWSKVKNVALLHLPSDKSFLNDYYLKYKLQFSPEHFVTVYQEYLSLKCNYNLLAGENIFKINRRSKLQFLKKKIKKLLH